MPIVAIGDQRSGIDKTKEVSPHGSEPGQADEILRRRKPPRLRMTRLRGGDADCTGDMWVDVDSGDRRSAIGNREVSRLRRLRFRLCGFPALTRWASLFRAYGAGALG